MTPPVVIKVGGSLLGWSGFPARLSAYLAARGDEAHVLIAGGGAAADIIRELDRIHGLGQEPSHHLALRALDLTAHLLAALVPRSCVVDRLDGLAPAWDHGHVPIFAPRGFLEREDVDSESPLAASWDVTSDSIAARVAIALRARMLVLLKSVPLPPGTDRLGAVRLGLVDPVFPEAARGLERVAFVNLRDFHDVGTPL